MKPEHPDEGFDVEDILEALEADSRPGILPNIVTVSAVRYGVAPDDPDRFVAMDTHRKQQDLDGDHARAAILHVLGLMQYSLSMRGHAQPARHHV